MSDLSYLKDPDWLADREKKWAETSARWLYGVSKSQQQTRKDYFFSGDVERYILDVEKPGLYYVIADTPLNNPDLVIKNIAKFWCWVMEEPDTRDIFEQFPDINERFHFQFHAMFSHKDDNLDPRVCTGLFFWLYGKSYQKNRIVTLKCDDRTVEIPITVNINALCQELADGIIEYLWYQDEDAGENVVIYREFIPYFLSIYPYMSKICFSTTLPEKEEFIDTDGKVYYRKYLIWNRWLLATINGFETKYEKDLGINKLVCKDEDALSELKNGLAELDMPEEYHLLLDFVLKNKGDSLHASE